MFLLRLVQHLDSKQRKEVKVMRYNRIVAHDGVSM